MQLTNCVIQELFHIIVAFRLFLIGYFQNFRLNSENFHLKFLSTNLKIQIITE